MQTEYLTFIADFSITGRCAYLSHQETLSLWQRTLVRARLPLVFSQGFNPRPRMSLPLPRSVGVQSDCERACALVQAATFGADTAGRAIAELLPAGFTLLSADVVAGKTAFYPVGATYRFSLLADPDAARRDLLEHCILQTQIHEPIVLERRKEKGRTQPIDIRPFLEDISHDGRTVTVHCAILPHGTVRIDELMRWLDLTPDALAEPVRRTAVRWVSDKTFFTTEDTSCHDTRNVN